MPTDRKLHHWERDTVEVEPLAYASAIAPDLKTYKDKVIFNITATGNITFNVPTNARPGQTVQYWVTASGGARTMSFHADILTPALVGGTPGQIASGKVRLLEITFNGTSWFVTIDREDA